jgi:hypothetical protein
VPAGGQGERAGVKAEIRFTTFILTLFEDRTKDNTGKSVFYKRGYGIFLKERVFTEVYGRVTGFRNDRS